MSYDWEVVLSVLYQYFIAVDHVGASICSWNIILSDESEACARVRRSGIYSGHLDKVERTDIFELWLSTSDF